MLKIYFLATFYLGYFQNPKKNVVIPKKMLPILKKMLPFQLATFWYVVNLDINYGRDFQNLTSKNFKKDITKSTEFEKILLT